MMIILLIFYKIFHVYLIAKELYVVRYSFGY